MSDTQTTTKPKNKLVQIDEMFGQERIKWTEKVKKLAYDLKDGDNLHEVAAYTLSYRQIIVENIASIASKIRTNKAKIDRGFKEAWIRYYQFEYKLNDKQREKFIDADMSEDLQVQELLEAHKDFLTATVKTLDNMGFAIKQRMDMKQL